MNRGRVAGSRKRLRIVGIGASAGGLEAFTELLRNLPPDAPLAYVLVQHLDPTHRSLLSELLAKTTTLPVQEIADNTRVEANRIYVIPPNCDLSIQRGVLKLTPRDKGGGPTRSIDHFLQSLALDQGRDAVGVILSGAGSDGAQGLRAIKEAGGVTFAQDDGSSKYDSMPRSAVATGCVDFVLSPPKIADELARLLETSNLQKRRAAANARQRRGTVTARPVRRPHADQKLIAWPKAPEDANLRKIFLLLRTRTGTDFSLYRINTIRRRVARRMSLNKVKGLEAYARFLREHPAEIDALYQDLLIHVTSFFRNPSVFDQLKRKVFPRLMKNSTSGEAIRIWVAGCSTGQEPYSIAMAYAEFAEQNENALPVQIFATDLNANILEQARAGRYTAAQLSGVGAARLRRFFHEENGGYRVSKPIRDLVIFAQQNLIIDPPFTRVDLISCRNLLIYLEPALQQKIIPAFHYALKPNGILVLGTSESVGTFHQLFEPLERGQKIYVKKPAASLLRFERPPVVPTTKALRVPPGAPVPREFNLADAFKEADRITLTKYGPVSVLVAEDGEILQFRGAADQYLDLPSGRASFQLLKMAREGLALPLQNAFERAKKENRVVREKDIRFDRRRGLVNIEVVPLKNLRARCFLILFERAAAKPQPEPVAAERGARHVAGRALASLKRDYAEAREHLANLQEAHDTSVEELQASNEEVQSTNEELQSLNEELETSNEELESANEELTTLNEELATRNAELRESEQRLREQAQMLELAPVIARSPKDRIIFWNRGAEKLYGYTREEAMGQTTHRFLNAQYSEPLEKIEKELHRRGHWSGEILHRRKDGQVICVASQWVLHHDSNRKIRAILEVNNDITARRQAEEALRQSEAFNRSILESSPDCIVVLDLAGRITFLNAAGQQLMESDAKKPARAYWPGLWPGAARVVAEKAYHAALSGETAHFREAWPTSAGNERWWDVAVRPILSGDGRPEKLLIVARDVTAHRRNEIALRDDARWAQFRADLAFAVIPSNGTEQIYAQAAEIIGRHFAAVFVGFWELAGAGFRLRGRGGTYSGQEPIGKFGDALARRISENREPFLLQAAATDASLWDPSWMQKEGVRSIVGHPLLIEDERCGAIAVFSQQDLDTRAVQELSLAVNAMGQALARKLAEDVRVRLTQEAFEARAEVELLNEVGRKMAAELDPQKLAQAVADAATQLVKAEAGAFVYSLREEKDRAFQQAVSGTRPELFAGFSERVRGLPEPVLAGQAPMSFEKLAAMPAGNGNGQHVNGSLPLRSFLALPVTLRSGDVVGGLFFGHTREHAFGGREERVALNLAGQAAIAMENARLVDHLERKVSERTARLQETISELQAFSYTVSHDLRAPLRAMQSYAQVLIEDCGPELTATARDYLKRIETAGVRLDRLIQDVLTYGRISRAQVVVQPLDLEKLLQALMQQYPMLRAPAADIRVHSPLPLILAEESSVTQCLSNLLGNAVKFVPPGRQPVVTIRAESRDGRVRIWIEDNGIGIAPQDHERIFKMFERVDTPREYEGTGIGLAIVRKAAERMGGAVGVESQPGEGSRFWLEFNEAKP